MENIVVVYNSLTNAERQIERVDSIVFFYDGIPGNSFYYSSTGKVKKPYEACKCVSLRKLLDSIYDTAIVGRLLYLNSQVRS